MRAFLVVVLVEGTSDLEFFPPVLTATARRALEERRKVQAEIRVELLHNGAEPRGAWVRDHIAVTHPQADLVLVHVDGSTNVPRALRNGFEPIERVWAPPPLGGGRLVPLVPVREMEAWALADLNVVRDVVGVDWDPGQVRESHLVDRPERLADPKATLGDILAQARRPRRRRRDASSYLPAIAENLPLESLRRLPSFQAFERDLHAVVNDSQKESGP